MTQTLTMLEASSSLMMGGILMKKVGEILKEMGFNPESSESTQRAFIKYLVRVANQNRQIPELADSDDQWHELKTHSRSIIRPENREPVQLSFTFVEKKTGSETG